MLSGNILNFFGFLSVLGIGLFSVWSLFWILVCFWRILTDYFSGVQKFVKVLDYRINFEDGHFSIFLSFVHFVHFLRILFNFRKIYNIF